MWLQKTIVETISYRFFFEFVQNSCWCWTSTPSRIKRINRADWHFSRTYQQHQQNIFFKIRWRVKCHFSTSSFVLCKLKWTHFGRYFFGFKFKLDNGIIAKTKNTTETASFNQKFAYKNIRFYSVLGIQKLDDVNGFVDIDLNVSSDWIISSQRSGESLQAYLNENVINVSAIEDVTLTCVLIDTNTSSLSAKCCESFPSTDLSQVSCSCNHATVFTIVLSVSARTVPYEVQVWGILVWKLCIQKAFELPELLQWQTS